MGIRREIFAALAVAVALAGESAVAQETIDKDGIRYQVIQQQIPTQVAVTEMQSKQQTTYRQQVTTENVQHQQVYHVPVTQYQVVSRLHNRWNPFAEPYWTHHYEPVTTWQQQVGTVQIPVNKVAMIPETRTVQQPVTTWKTVNNTITHHRAIGMTPTPGSNTAMASAQPMNSAPSAALSPVAPGSSQPAASVASRPMGGQTMQSDPPRYGATPAANSGWPQAQPLVSQPAATTPAPAPVQSSRY